MTSSIQFDPGRLQLAFNLVNESVQNQSLPSAVLAVANSCETIRCEAFSREGCDRAKTDSIFLLTSISKPILATAVLQLVEDGQLMLSTPITQHIPEFAAPGKPLVTVWNILTHTSGMDEIDWLTLLQNQIPLSEIIQAVYRGHLHFTPGSRYEYCTQSFYVLAELITRLSGKPYPECLRDRIFSPLGMTDTSFDPHVGDERVVLLHNIDEDQSSDQEQITHYLVSLAMPGAGLWSTTADLITFGQTYLHSGTRNGYQLLSPAFIELMTREHTTGLFGLVDGQPKAAHYGLGWGKTSLEGSLPGSPHVFEHTGVSGTWLWIDPEWDLIYVFLTNQLDGDGHVQARALQVVYSALRR